MKLSKINFNTKTRISIIPKINLKNIKSLFGFLLYYETPKTINERKQEIFPC